jgi:type IV pilus assembly protein PilA
MKSFRKKSQKGFTLIELMVVIVIIGILSAMAIPKMFSVSAKAKAAEAPNVISTYEVLQSSYYQEKSIVGDSTAIGFSTPRNSKWFTYDAGTAGTVKATVSTGFGSCTTSDFWQSVYAGSSDSFTHTKPTTAKCAAYTVNF